MVKIRLKRGGKKNRPFYRLVVMDSRSRRDGPVIESVGYYDPLTKPSTVNLMEDRVRWWIGQGAQMTESVRSLLKQAGTLEKVEAPAAEEPGAAPPAQGA